MQAKQDCRGELERAGMNAARLESGTARETAAAAKAGNENYERVTERIGESGGGDSELGGTATWSKSALVGQGSFHCTVSGHSAIGGTTNGEVPCTGSISGGAPRPAG